MRSLLADRDATLAALVDTVHDLVTPYDLDTLLRVIGRRARRLLDLHLVCIVFTRPDGTSYIRTSEGETVPYHLGLDLGPGHGGGLAALAHERRVPVWTADHPADPAVPRSPRTDEVFRAEALRAVVAVPLRHGDTALGTLYGAVRAVRRFTPDELGVLLPLADLAAVAIEKAGRQERTRDEVTELEHLSSEATTTLTRVRHLWDCHTRLARLVLDGAGLATVARAAADALDGVLQVRDPGGHPLTAADELPDLDEPAVARATLRAHTAFRPVELPGNVWVAAVTAGAENLGVLVLRAAAPLTAEDVRLLRATALSVASLTLIQRGTAAAESGPVRDELLQELLDRSAYAEAISGEYGDRLLLDRARRLGIDPAAPHVVVVARPEGGDLGKAVAWASSYTYRMGGLRAVRRGRIVLLLPGTDASAAARQVSAELSPLLGHPVSTGAAGPAADLSALARVYEEAARCLDALTALDGAGGTASLSDLGFVGLLLSADHDVDAFVRSAIGPVLDYDAARLTELGRTLEAYFQSGGSPMHSAEALHVHANTVSRRLERITELLGDGWQKPARALEIQMALRLYRTREVLRGSRTSRTGPAVR
ncbi:transcriptional regulator [Streptomyces venezuelae]|uniref:Transcriptional regulator n=1 Tax=Streptomyces venezuelae TaxID=54571 RepID=A0A5P2D2H2_STRVZ|nr:helix-turn-helix domain-containing protein [Streptomyces venezuelae]QES49335.1 transcriptional regulator [Streptomyces venezuelae]